MLTQVVKNGKKVFFLQKNLRISKNCSNFAD